MMVTNGSGKIQVITVVYKTGMHVIELLAIVSKRIPSYTNTGSHPMEEYIILRDNHKPLKLETNLRELFQKKLILEIYAYLLPENVEAIYELPRQVNELIKGTKFKNPTELIYVFAHFYNNILIGFANSLKSVHLKCEFIKALIGTMESRRTTFAAQLNNLNIKLELATQSYSMDLNQLELQRDGGFYSQKMTNSWRINTEHESIQKLNENSTSTMYQEPNTTLAAIYKCLTISEQRVKDLDANFKQVILVELKTLNSKSLRINEIISDISKNLEAIFTQFYKEIQAILRCTFALKSESEKLILSIDNDIKNTELLEKKLIGKQLDRQRDIWKLIRLSGSSVLVQAKSVTPSDCEMDKIAALLDKEIGDFSDLRKEIKLLFNDLKE